MSRAKRHDIQKYVDIVICDGGSTDDCTNDKKLKTLGVNSLLVKQGSGKQGAQLRMGIWWALERGYKGVITIDGNNKDSIEDILRFIEKLKNGYDLIQGSRFIKGGKAIRTPLVRLMAVKLIHAPTISLTAHKRFTDTMNAYRGYSARYLMDEKVKPLHGCFMSYELLVYLSVRATQIGMKACEIPVTRAYLKKGKIPTKITFFKGSIALFCILIKMQKEIIIHISIVGIIKNRFANKSVQNRERSIYEKSYDCIWHTTGGNKNLSFDK